MFMTFLHSYKLLEIERPLLARACAKRLSVGDGTVAAAYARSTVPRSNDLACSNVMSNESRLAPKSGFPLPSTTRQTIN